MNRKLLRCVRAQIDRRLCLNTQASFLVTDTTFALQVIKASAGLPSLTLTPRQLCDIELLMNGGFSPLDRFMDEAMYNSVVADMRLGPQLNNAIFPMPITLDVRSKVVYRTV